MDKTGKRFETRVVDSFPIVAGDVGRFMSHDRIDGGLVVGFFISGDGLEDMAEGSKGKPRSIEAA